MVFLYKKSLGQNFIYDEKFLDSIVAELGLSANGVVVEVGTGAGTLTNVLSRHAKRVFTIEIDKRLEPVLSKKFEGLKNVELIFGDALEMKLDFISTPYKLVANIPYYITTPLITKFMADENCREISVLVQEELGQRMVAKIGGKDYGALSVAVQLWGEARIVKRVPRAIFKPVPNVDSVFVQVKRRENLVSISSLGKSCGTPPQQQSCLRSSNSYSDLPSQKSTQGFHVMLKQIFSQRRKTMLNAVSAWLNMGKGEVAAILAGVGIETNLRPEQITPEQYKNLYLFTKKDKK